MAGCARTNSSSSGAKLAHPGSAARVAGWTRHSASRSAALYGSEVELLGAHQPLERVERAVRVVRHGDVADASRLLPLAQHRNARLDVEQVVHLHRIDPLRARIGDASMTLPPASKKRRSTADKGSRFRALLPTSNASRE